MSDKMRGAFEAWFAKKDFGPNGLRKIDAEYVHAPAATYWLVWQAATLAERERCALACENERVEDTGHESDYGYNMAIGHCATAIRQGGAS